MHVRLNLQTQRVIDIEQGENKETENNVSQWGTMSETIPSEAKLEVDQTIKSFRGETPKIEDFVRDTDAPQTVNSSQRTHEWLEKTGLPVAKEVRVTLGTRCKCTREILQDINAQAKAELRRNIAQGDEEVGDASHSEAMKGIGILRCRVT